MLSKVGVYTAFVVAATVGSLEVVFLTGIAQHHVIEGESCIIASPQFVTYWCTTELAIWINNRSKIEM